MPSPPLRILVAESDEIVLALLAHILYRQGFEVDVALTADQVKLRLTQSPYAGLVVDSGLVSVVEAGSDGHLSRTILLSPDETSDLRVHAVIQKPVEFGLLIDTVRKMIE